MIQEKILELTEYGMVTGLVAPEDKRYTINRLLELFGLEELTDETVEAYEKRTPMDRTAAEEALEGILEEMLDYAAEEGLLPENTITYRDLFDTKIMGMLVPLPSQVTAHFMELYREEGAQAATDYFYQLSRDTNYIRRYRIKRTASGRLKPNLEHLTSRLICQNRKRIRKRLRRQSLQNRVVIRNACSARKMRVTQEESIIRQDRITALFR